jgi:hypothetical protein
MKDSIKKYRKCEKCNPVHVKYIDKFSSTPKKEIPLIQSKGLNITFKNL